MKLPVVAAFHYFKVSCITASKKNNFRSVSYRFGPHPWKFEIRDNGRWKFRVRHVFYQRVKLLKALEVTEAGKSFLIINLISTCSKAFRVALWMAQEANTNLSEASKPLTLDNFTFRFNITAPAAIRAYQAL